MKENYKDIKEYEGLYKISNYGNVYSIKSNKILKPETTKAGYRLVMLIKNKKAKGFYIHRLVAKTFISNPNNYPFVLHKKAIIDGGNDFVENLYWGTPLDNTLDRKRDGHSVALNGKDNPNSKKINQYDLKMNFIKQWDCIADASKTLKIHREQISRVCRKCPRRKSTHGFIFEYADNKTY